MMAIFKKKKKTTQEIFAELELSFESKAIDLYKLAINYEFTNSELKPKNIRPILCDLLEIIDDFDIEKKFNSRPTNLKNFWILIYNLIHNIYESEKVWGIVLDQKKFYLLHVEFMNNKEQVIVSVLLHWRKTNWKLSLIPYGLIKPGYNPCVKFIHLL